MATLIRHTLVRTSAQIFSSLRRIVPRFTDGFGTKDLKEAKARLDELAQPGNSRRRNYFSRQL